MKNICLSLPNKLNAEILSDNEFKFDKNAELLAKAYIPEVKFLKNKPNFFAQNSRC